MKQVRSKIEQNNPIYEDYEQSDGQSEPMVEEVDENYIPTDKQVKQYAVQVLGMNLPEDQNLLYLARQGLTAPLPPNWIPYQSRDGDVYYKHRITQQKMYDHPTDVEYMKKYEQMQQKMVRKNLKSISKPPPSLMAKPPQISNQLHPTHLQQLQELQFKLAAQLNQFIEESTRKHQQKLTQIKQTHHQNLKNIFTNQQTKLQIYTKQKQAISENIRATFEEKLNQQLEQLSAQHRDRFIQIQAIFEEDNKIKVGKYQENKQSQLEKAIRRLQNRKYQLQKYHHQQKQRKSRILEQKLKEFQKEDNSEIEVQTRKTYNKTINLLQEQYVAKLQSLKTKLQSQYQQTKKILGQDPLDELMQIAQKRERMRNISRQKQLSLRNKMQQQLQYDFGNRFRKQKGEIQKEQRIKKDEELLKVKKLLQTELEQWKITLKKEINERIIKGNQKIQEQNQKHLSSYQISMRNKITQLRQSNIKHIKQRSQSITKVGRNDFIQKIQHIQNVILNVKDLINLESGLLRDLQFDRKLSEVQNIDQWLQKMMKQVGVSYKSQICKRHRQIYEQIKKQYRSDKEALGQIMMKLQSSSYIRHQDGKNSELEASSYFGNGPLIKKYNADIRLMRENEIMLKEYENILKKAERGDVSSIDILQREQIKEQSKFTYKKVNIVQQFHHQHQANTYTYNTISQNGVNEILAKQTKFFNNIKSELNKKIYELRILGMNHY